MGCDVHAYVEYAKPREGDAYWQTVGGRINPGRDYDLFAKLAGVRTDNEAAQMIPVRGLPEKHSLTVLWDNQLYVSDDGEGDEYCSRANAENWVASGYSIWTRDDKSAVTQPDWHTHSWCSTAELRAVLEAKRPHGWDIDPAYWAVLASLEELERRGCEARLVFWFDN